MLSAVTAICVVVAGSWTLAADCPVLYWTFGDADRVVDRTGIPVFTGLKYDSIDLAYPVTIGPVASAIESNGFAARESSSTPGGAYVRDYKYTPLDITDTVSVFARINPGAPGKVDDIFAARNRSQDSADPRYINIRYGFECDAAGMPNFQLQGAGNTASTVISLGTALTPGTWYDLIGTFDQGVANFYVQETVSGNVLGDITWTMPFTSLAAADPVNERAEIHLLHNSWNTNGPSEGYQVEQVAVWNSLATPTDILTNGITVPDPLPQPPLPAVTPTCYWIFGNEGVDVADEGEATNLVFSNLNPNTTMHANAKRSNNLGIREGTNPGGLTGWGWAGVVSDTELDITGAVSIYARIKADAFDGIDDIARSNLPAGSGVRADQYGLELDNGVPRFVVTDANSFTNTVAVGLNEDPLSGGTAITTGVWYDITGVFEPTTTGGLISITVYESETGVLVGETYKEVPFSQLISNEFDDSARVEFHVFAVPQSVNGQNPGMSLEQLAVWDQALTSEQIADLTVMSTPNIPGDADGNGVVDGFDAQTLAANWGAAGATWAMGDFNGDGLVGAADASIMAANWSAGFGEATAVPEPSALALLIGLACLGLSAWRGWNKHGSGG
ncbi:MAG: hypothetical protein JW888_10410 [Pirellulales bacterium]|nr:hypothetical protein [Pirellulales bacterium]